MIINMFKKGVNLFKRLEHLNQTILDIDNKYKSLNVSFWFDPAQVRTLWLSRTYPLPDPSVQQRSEYCLVIHASNYMSLFLSEVIFADRKDIMIEDFGVGDGRLFFYLSALGFKNFSGWDSWTQLPEVIYIDMMTAANLAPRLNDPTVNPVMVNNSHAPFTFITHGFDDRVSVDCNNRINLNVYRDRDISATELLVFYTNRDWENNLALQFLPKRGFRFLCKDSDDLAVAWCREDKYAEFSAKIKEYEV